MRAVVQRVSSANVLVEGRVVGAIERGFVVLVGVAADDAEADLELIVQKVAGLRVFEDADGKMNLSLAEVGGSILAISQFTLYGDCRKGRRPSFGDAMPPEAAARWFEAYVEKTRALGIRVETGVFRTHMDVSLTNDGPVTLLVDSRKTF